MLIPQAMSRLWPRQMESNDPNSFPFSPLRLPSRKEVTFRANPDVPNLSIFNRLRRVPATAKGEGKCPWPAHLPPTWTRSKSRTKPGVPFRPFATLLKSKNLDRQQTYCGTCGQNCGPDRNSHCDHRNPEPIEQAGMKRHIGNGVNLRIEWDQMIAP